MRSGKAVARRQPRKTGMNRLEARFSMVLEAQRREGLILWWGFEAMKLRLAARTHYTPDFMVVTAEGEIVFYETKGFWRDDARVKIKVAAETYPFFRFVGVTNKGRQWQHEEF